MKIKTNINNKINWIDFKALERDDVDEKFELFDFLFFGSRWVKKRAWWVFVPPLNGLIAISILSALISMPIRWYISSNQLRWLRKNAYDIEDTCSLYRLIRDVNGNIGLCEWGESFEFSRKVLLPSQYVKIDRWGVDGFIVTDKNNKMGLFSTETCKWIFPCSCDNISIESNDIINVIINNRSQRYNSKGDRIVS